MLVNYNKLTEYNQKKSLESSKLFENYNIYDPDFVTKFNPDIKPKICDKRNTCMCQPESLLDKVKL